MKVTLMLADSAQAVGGKLYILGGGWSRCAGPIPFAIAAKIEVPWDEASRGHSWRLALLDMDGNQVEVAATPDERKPIVVEGTLSTGIPAGLRPGTPIDSVLAMNFTPVPLEPGRYVWELSIDGRSDEDWRLAFEQTAPAGGARQTGG